ncbi:MAG: DUF1707 domain-containing protein [Nocardioides sp.]|jgi:hypothetical protein
MGDMQRPDPSKFRVSDDDRHKVAELLREAAGAGRLDLDELDERLEKAYAAKTYADLIPITADLPSQAATPQVPAAHARGDHLPVPGATHSATTAVLSEVKREGAWLVPEFSTAFAFMGDVTLDLREATLESDEVTITVTAIMSDVKVIVDAHTRVELDGTPILGEFKQGKEHLPAQFDANSPLVRIKGLALLGSVKSIRQPPRGTPRKFLGTF